MGESRVPNQRQEIIERWKVGARRIYRLAEHRDQLIVAGAGGALLVSITLLDQIATDPDAWTLVILLLAWAALLVSLGSALWSMYSMENALRAWLDNNEEKEQQANKVTTAHDKRARRCLFVGAVLLTLFAAVNLPW